MSKKFSEFTPETSFADTDEFVGRRPSRGSGETANIRTTYAQATALLAKQADLDTNKAAANQHPIAGVTGLQAALDAKEDSANLGDAAYKDTGTLAGDVAAGDAPAAAVAAHDASGAAHGGNVPTTAQKASLDANATLSGVNPVASEAQIVDEGADLKSTGQAGDRILVTNGANGFIYEDKPTGGGGATDLSIVSRTATTYDTASSTGLNATNPAATGTLAGLMTAAHQVKVEADDTPADPRDPKAHTQAASTITDFDTEVANNAAVVANTAKVSADGSVDTHSDVDITTAAPQDGEALVWQTNKFVPAPVSGGGDGLHASLTDTATDGHPGTVITIAAGVQGNAVSIAADGSLQDSGVPPGGAGGSTDLSIVNRTATTYDTASSSGQNATNPAATGTLAGLMTAAHQAKVEADDTPSDPRDPNAHAATHATGQADAIAPSDIGAEPAFAKNTAFNKNFGALVDTTCQGNDSRLSDARTPTAHAATHASGQADEITPAAIGAATSAQGTLADSAVQPGDALTDLSSGAATLNHVPLAGGDGSIAWGAAPGGGSWTDGATITYWIDGGQKPGTTSGTTVLPATSGHSAELTLGGNHIINITATAPGATEFLHGDILVASGGFTPADIQFNGVSMGTTTGLFPNDANYSVAWVATSTMTGFTVAELA